MKINAISQRNSKNTLKQNKVNSYKINSQIQDTVSFGKGKYEKETKPKWRFTLPAIGTAFATLLSGCNSTNNIASNQQTTAPIELVETTVIEETVPVSTLSLLEENNKFQLAQTMDSVSLAFDFTDNYKAWEKEPNMSSVVLSKKPNKNHIEEFENLKKAILEAYEVKEDDTPIIRSIAHSILKANPDMLTLIDGDFEQGDVTNIELDTILNANYSKDGNFRIELPKVTIMAERRNDFDTSLQVSAEFLPSNRDENNIAIISINKDDFKKAKNDEAKLELVGEILADAYGIPAFNSYAGDAIWHGVALYKENYEIFEGVDEKDTKDALLKYIDENGSVELSLPRIAVTVMSSEVEAIADDILTQEKDLGVTISYMTVSQPVFDLNGEDSFRPIDVLDFVQFKDGSTIKEAYEENADKYESLALAAWQQQVDNNNALIKYYGANTIEAEDLYVEIEADEVGLEDGKINLQPVAIAHPDCRMTCASEVKAPKKQTQKDEEAPQTPTIKPQAPTETEPSKPTEPTKPSEPTEPTEPSKPTEPEETTCPTEPPIDKPDTGIDVTKPTLPSRPQETTPPETEAPCPTEAPMPDTDEDDSNIKGDEGGFDFDDTPTPTQPQATTPPATEAPCPTEGKTPDTNQNNNDVQGDQGGFEEVATASVEKSVAPVSQPKSEPKAEVKTEPKSEPKVEVKSEPKVESVAPTQAQAPVTVVQEVVIAKEEDMGFDFE